MYIAMAVSLLHFFLCDIAEQLAKHLAVNGLYFEAIVLHEKLSETLASFG